MPARSRSPRRLHSVLAITCLVWVPLACGSGASGPNPDDADLLTSGGTSGQAGTGGSGGTETPLSEGDRFLRDYASAVCATYEPCCNAAGMGYDAGGCTAWFAAVTAAYLPDEFRPAEGASCLTALAEARAQDPDRCNTVAVFDEASLRSQCSKAFVAPARDGAPLGGQCLLAADCAASSSGSVEGDVICYASTCVLQRQGAPGDGPCYAGGNVGLEQEMFTCDAATGLYCDRANNACAARVGDGERCPYSNACDDTSMCVGGTCRRLPDSGEPCLNGVPGAGGYCRAGTSCDVSTLLCGPPITTGGACSQTLQCASGVCIDGECAPSDWQRNLNCTG